MDLTRLAIAMLAAAFALLAGCALQQPPAPAAAAQNVSILLLSPPSSAPPGMVELTWKIASDRPVVLLHTAIHYGYSSVASDPTPAKYPYSSDILEILEGNTPDTFTARIPANSSGTLYYRAHALIGSTSYWTDERNITITGQ